MCIHSSQIPASMCSVCTPVRRAAIKRQATQVRSRSIPTWTQWLRFRSTRPLAHQRLCIMCLHALDILCGIHKPGSPDTDVIKLGCRVKVSETTKFTVCNVEYEEVTQKVMPVMLSGLGCSTCQYFYGKSEAAELDRYAKEDAGHCKDLLDPRKGKLLREYGCTAPSKRQAVIDVTDLVLEMDRTPLQIQNHTEVAHG